MTQLFGTSIAVVVGAGTVFQPVQKSSGGCICGITDTFARTVTGGWGTSDANIAWSLYNTITSASVTPGSAFVSSSTTSGGFTAQLNFDAQGDINVLLTGIVLGLPASVPNGFYVDMSFNLFASNTDVMVSQQPTQTLLSIGFPTGGGGTSTNFVTMPVSTSSPFNMRLVRTGTSFMVRVWAGGTEPSTWNLTATSSGAINAFAFGAFTQIPSAPTVSTTVASVDISNVNKCTSYQFDNFNRTVASGWGTATLGAVWTAFPATGASINVDGSFGNLTDTNSSGGSVMVTTAPMAVNTDFTMTALISWTFMDPAGAIITNFSLGTGGFGFNIEASSTPGTGANQGQIQLDGPTGPLATFTATFDEWYVEWKYTASTHAVEFRIWVAGTARPSSPFLTDTFTWTGTAEFDVANVNHTSSALEGLAVDFIDFAYAGKPCF